MEAENELLAFPQLPEETLYERFIAARGFFECGRITLTSHTDYDAGGWLSPEAEMIVPDIQDVIESIGMVLNTYGKEYAERRAKANGGS